MATPRSVGGRLHARVGAAAFLLIAALIGASVLLVAGPAGADVNTVTGSAFGISGLSGPPSAPGSSGSALLEGVAIGGIAVAASPPANTVVAIPNVLRAVLNEQTVDDAPGSTGIAVRAIDLQVLPDNHGRAALEVILAESR